MKKDLILRPIHYASVSGGKDSFYMLNIILNNLEKYPLDMVVHFELEIDWNWSKQVVELIQARCESAGIPFLRIKPRQSWEYYYKKYGFPNAKARWCNSEYKLDCKKQLETWIREQNCRPVAYIGFCADETSRFKYEIGKWEEQDCCYPLAEEGITEDTILEWAKTVPLFDNYYKYFRRQGCKLCPFLSMKEMAYLYIKDSDTFDYMFECIKQTEERILKEKNKKWLFRNVGADIIRERITSKWYNYLTFEMNQIDMFEIYDMRTDT